MRLKEHNRDRSRISTDVENGDSGPGSYILSSFRMKERKFLEEKDPPSR